MRDQMERPTKSGLRLGRRFWALIGNFITLFKDLLVWVYDLIILGICGGLSRLAGRNQRVAIGLKMVVASFLIFLICRGVFSYLNIGFYRLSSLSTTSVLEEAIPRQLKSYEPPPDQIWVEQRVDDFARELRKKHGLDVEPEDIVGGQELKFRKRPGRYLKKGSSVRYVQEEGRTKVIVNG